MSSYWHFLHEICLLLALFWTPTIGAYLDYVTPKRRYYTEQVLAPPLPRAVRGIPQEFPRNAMNTIDGAASFDPFVYQDKGLLITYTNDPRQVSQWLSNNVPVGCPSCLGFDTESVPGLLSRSALFYGPATIQLSTPDAALVVQLVMGGVSDRRKRRRSSNCLPILDAVLRDQNIVKAGVAVDDDLIALHDACNIAGAARSRLDLGGLGGDNFNSTAQHCGLKRMANSILGLELPKSKRTARSDWTNPLTSHQIVYAGRDAWTAAAVVDVLGTCAPEMFAPAALKLWPPLQAQRTIHELWERLRSRQHAKLLLSAMKTNCGAPWPAWKRHTVQDLKSVIEQNCHEPPPVLDVGSLGFCLDMT